MKVPIPNNLITQFDQFYRYKRSVLEKRQEKNFTVLLNLHDIANELHVPLTHLITFLNKKLGQKLQPDKVKNSNLIRLKHTDSDLEECLEIYIQKYVLCKKCGLPELNEKNICNSCGYNI